VPDALAERHGIRELEGGAPILAAGQLSERWAISGGQSGKRAAIVAALVHPGPLPSYHELLIPGVGREPQAIRPSTPTRRGGKREHSAPPSAAALPEAANSAPADHARRSGASDRAWQPDRRRRAPRLPEAGTRGRRRRRPVNELLFEHVVAGRYHPSVVAENLPPCITEILGATTREDWQAVADELIAEAREADGEA
jgi:hypothetical protein